MNLMFLYIKCNKSYTYLKIYKNRCRSVSRQVFNPHHFRFYLKDNKPFVYIKNCARDFVLEPTNEVPERGPKLKFPEVEHANKHDIKVKKVLCN